MKKIQYFLHYFFGKHRWEFRAKSFKGNESIGHREDSYIFECKICPKQKIVKVE